MASDPERPLPVGPRDVSPEPARDSDPVDFRERIAAMPRLLDDSDLREFRNLGLDVEAIRRTRRQYLRELLGDLERESARVAGLMAQAPDANLAEIVEFRNATRAHIRHMRILAAMHRLGLPVDARSRRRSALL